MNIKDILLRIGYARNKARLSARELSLKMGMSSQYVAKIESGNITLSVEKLLEILKICQFSEEKFFSENPYEYDSQQELFNLINNLSNEKKRHLIEFLKK